MWKTLGTKKILKITPLIQSGFLILLTLVVFWPSFFHVFRNDEWHFFFISRFENLDFSYILNHLDWQLQLGHDRLLFRPLHHTDIALNRVLFDIHYSGPHILNFIKHLGVVFALWKLLSQTNPGLPAYLFAMLFSVLSLGSDAVFWPHVSGYLYVSLFTILAIILLRKSLTQETPSKKSLRLISLWTLLAMFSNESGLILPFVLTGMCFILLRSAQKKYFLSYITHTAFIPLIAWSSCYGIHLFLAYPNWNIGFQSYLIPLWKIPRNLFRFLFMIVFGITMPVFSYPLLGDIVRFLVIPPAKRILQACCSVFLAAVLIRKTKENRNHIFCALFLLMAAGFIITAGRSAYVDSLLSERKIDSHHVYFTSMAAIWLLSELTQAKNRKRKNMVLFLLILGIMAHSAKTHSLGNEITQKTAPLKNYFDAVASFVKHHKDTPNFSFFMQERPPKTPVFYWESEHCIDGLFFRYLNPEKPLYWLSYDLKTQALTARKNAQLQ